MTSCPTDDKAHQGACFGEGGEDRVVQSPPSNGKSGEAPSKVFTVSDAWNDLSPAVGGDRTSASILIEWMEVEVKNRLVFINEKLEKILAEYDEESVDEKPKNRRGSLWSTGDGDIVVPEGMSEAGLAVVRRISNRSVISISHHNAPDELGNGIAQDDDNVQRKSKSSGVPKMSILGAPGAVAKSRGPSYVRSSPSGNGLLPTFSFQSKISARAHGLVQSVLSNANSDRVAGTSSMASADFSNKASSCEATCGEVSTEKTRETRGTDMRGILDRVFETVGLGDEEEGTLTPTDKLWHFLEDPESGPKAHMYHVLITGFICITVLWSLLQSSNPPPLSRRKGEVVEISFDCVFALEFLLRFLCCPAKCQFFLGTYNIIDLAVAALLIFRTSIRYEMDDENNFSVDLLLTLTPALRLMKTLRRFQKFHLIFSAFESALEALPVLLWTLLLTTLTFSALIFLVEPRDNIDSLPTAMWLTIVTMTTVGYGDVTPKSATGSMFTAVLIVSSVLYMAMPLAIIGQSFSTIWGERDRILLIQQTRKRLLQWGYTAQDIPVLFSLFDGDGSGELELPEFSSMIKAMRVGLKEERVVQLFESFDTDGSGAIDDCEFVRFVFPSSYAHLYDKLTRNSTNSRSSKISRSSRFSKASNVSRSTRSKLSPITDLRRRESTRSERRDSGVSEGSCVEEALAFAGGAKSLPARPIARQSLALPAGAPPPLGPRQSLSLVVPGGIGS